MRQSLSTVFFASLLLLAACDSGPGANEPPSVTFSYNPQQPTIGQTVNFTANATDPDGQIAAYSWDFNDDGAQDASGPNPTYTFQEEGTFSVRLAVTDDRGGTDTSVAVVAVALPPNETPSASFSYSPQQPRAGEPVDFTANATDPDGQIAAYSWDFDGDGAEDATGPSPAYTFEEQGTFNAILTVTDDRDGTATASETVSVLQRFTQVTVTRITVRGMPFTNSSGESWDVFTYPDVYSIILNRNGRFLYTSAYFSDVSPGDLPIAFTNVQFMITDFDESFGVGIVDFDSGSSNEVIDALDLTIADLDVIGTYPNTITLSNGTTELELDVEWSR